jgi:ribosomal protein S18 acetylase RimI-like enzyme
MTVEPFRADDIAAFLKMATAEGWVADSWEFAFLLAVFPEGCFCMRDSTGKGVAFVTSLCHENSGWIGNLIVAEEFRGKGLGKALFKNALEALHAAGVGTFWLTASAMGKSLYESYGFSSIDTIARWVGTGRQRHATCGKNCESLSIVQSVISIDSHSWGDRRKPLLAATMDRGQLVHEDSGFIVVQLCGEAIQLGPFSALDSGTAEVLFETALRTIPLGKKVFLDAPVSNRSALRLFNRKGMRIAGRNELMFAGVKPDYRPEMLYGLATMGSCG